MSTIATPHVIVLRAPGTNCDEETAACLGSCWGPRRDLACGPPVRGTPGAGRFQILTIPGGFSYGDDLGRAGSWPRGWVTFWATPCGGSTTAAA